MNNKAEFLERERRWGLPAGIASVAAVAIYFVGQLYGNSALSSGGPADTLVSLEGHETAAVIGAVVQGIGIALLAVPLFYLFKAAVARSSRMRPGLVWLVIAAPIFLGIGGIISIGTLVQASDKFDESSPAITKCFDDKVADSTAELTQEKQDDLRDDCRDTEAQDLRTESSLASSALGLALAGGFGFIFAMVYTTLNSMRVGLVSRFWGSLGMALGVVAILPQLFIFTLVWFIYAGVLFAGWIPGGRPPTWETGVATAWPPPRTAPGDGDDDVIEGTAEELADDPPESDPDAPQVERRKRKRRSP